MMSGGIRGKIELCTRVSLAAGLVMSASFALSACAPKQFGFSQTSRLENFDMVVARLTTAATAPRADVLFVVDSSGSMDPFQQKLRDAFQRFSQNYLQSNSEFGQWDVRMASIATDAYLSNGTAPLLTAMNTSTILNPSATVPKSMILSTIPTDGVAADGAWWAGIQRGFNSIVTRGTRGSGVESATASLRKLIQSNESTGHCAPDTFGNQAGDCLFRPATTWVVVVVSDEENNLCVDRTLTGDFTNYFTPTCSGGVNETTETLSALNSLYDSRNPGAPERRYFSVAVSDENYANSSIIDLSLRRKTDLNGGFFPGNASHHNWIDAVKGQGTEVAQYSEVRNIFDPNFNGIMENLASSLIETSTTIVPVFEFTLSATPVSGSVVVVLNSKDGTQHYTLGSGDYLLQGRLIKVLQNQLPSGVTSENYRNYQIQVSYLPSPI